MNIKATNIQPHTYNEKFCQESVKPFSKCLDCKYCRDRLLHALCHYTLPKFSNLCNAALLKLHDLGTIITVKYIDEILIVKDIDLAYLNFQFFSKCGH